jgi:hypothetical protein
MAQRRPADFAAADRGVGPRGRRGRELLVHAEVPEPANWQASRWVPVWLTVGVLAFTSFGLYWSAVATIRGHYLTPVALFGICVFPFGGGSRCRTGQRAEAWRTKGSSKPGSSSGSS